MEQVLRLGAILWKNSNSKRVRSLVERNRKRENSRNVSQRRDLIQVGRAEKEEACGILSRIR